MGRNDNHQNILARRMWWNLLVLARKQKDQENEILEYHVVRT